MTKPQKIEGGKKDKIKIRLMWIYWKLTGYRELSELIRAMSGFSPLTPTGLKRANELAAKEAHLRRLLNGIESL